MGYDINTFDPLQHFIDQSKELDEVYEVIRTVVIGGKNWKYYRLDVVKQYLGTTSHPPFHYTVLAFVEDVHEAARTLSDDQVVLGTTRIWTRWTTFPSILQDDADAALKEALRVLAERIQ